MNPITFSHFTGPSRDSGSQVCFKCCPACGCDRWKTYLDPDTGKWYCFAPEHSAGGCVDVGLPMVGAGADILEKLDGAHQEPAWPEIELPAWETLSRRAERYLTRRGVSLGLAQQLGIVEMQDAMRVLVPYCATDGRIIHWTGRKYSTLEDGPKYLNAPGKHPLYVLPGSGALVAVEGVFDAIAVHEATGRYTAAIGGKSLAKHLVQDLLQLVAWRGTVQLVLDGDAIDAALRIKGQLQGRCHISVVPLPPGEDPGSLSHQNLREVLA